MTVYLNKTDCEIVLKKTIATACKKLRDINEIQDQNDEKYKKLFGELKILNKIVKYVTIYKNNLT